MRRMILSALFVIGSISSTGVAQADVCLLNLFCGLQSTCTGIVNYCPGANSCSGGISVNICQNAGSCFGTVNICRNASCSGGINVCNFGAPEGLRVAS